MGQKVEITSDWKQVANDPEIDVIVELVAQPRTALSIARKTLKNGKHLVTANKFLVAEHGVELFRLSQQKMFPLVLKPVSPAVHPSSMPSEKG